tara:strand:- start:29 stop:220 length:192 start_codon:yes stop_codon:yes gene_type:complete
MGNINYFELIETMNGKWIVVQGQKHSINRMWSYDEKVDAITKLRELAEEMPETHKDGKSVQDE